MESSLISNRLLNYLEQYEEIDAKGKKELAAGTIEIVGSFFYELSAPSSWHLRDIKRTDHHEFVFSWTSDTEHAICSVCGTVSHARVKSYLTRDIQDLPISEMTVYHAIKANRYYCQNPVCVLQTFIEQFDEIVEKDSRLSNRLKDFIIRQAIESSCNALPKSLRSIGVKVSRDTILRLVKKKGASVLAQNFERDDVKVLSIDDVNLKKGNSSSACSVFIDGETHRALVIVQGATQEIAQKVIKQFPSVDMVSRDRGTAYAAAAKKCDKPQVADGFHLVQNLHEAVKDALYQEIPHDLFLHEGEGWIGTADHPREEPVSDTATSDHSDDLVAMQPATLEKGDIERRIHLAGLTDKQAKKYKKTLEVLELTESGLRTPEIAKRLSVTSKDVSNYRKHASKTIQNAELKIDEYYQLHEQGQWEYHQKTIAQNARPSYESIVAPYKDTVLSMFKEGENHRNIHPVIEKEGFKGSANTVYQYLIKYAHENAIPYGRNCRVIPSEERHVDGAPPRPPRISIERTSRTAIYKRLLHIAAEKRQEIKQALLGLEAVPTDGLNKKNQSNSEQWMNKTCYADSIAEIVFDTEPKKSNVKKKLSKKAFKRLEDAFDLIPCLSAFLLAFYDILLHGEVAKLDRFIEEYQNNSVDPLSVFASGLKKDYEAVKNCLLYPDISNGPMEGTNNKIKMVRRRGYGRAGVELLNALLVLPWYYNDLDESKNGKAQNTTAA